MKKFIFAVAMGLMSLMITTPVQAQPAKDNPNVVVYYETGVHAIPTDPVQWDTGTDIVLRAGKSGNFIQWFIGDDYSVQSVWNYAKNGTCRPGGVLIQNANPVGPDVGWGSYLVEGADYCVYNNFIPTAL